MVLEVPALMTYSNPPIAALSNGLVRRDDVVHGGSPDLLVLLGHTARNVRVHAAPKCL
jgi:hypothetical protein